MSLTYPAAFCFQNAATTATITVPGALSTTPGSVLQDPHTGYRVRWESDTAYLTFALAAATTIDTFGLFGVRALSSAGVDLTSSIISRVRASLTDASAQDGAVYDSGSAAGRLSAYYENLVCLRDGSASALYGRIDLSCTGAAILEAGFLMVGLRNQATINFAPGAGDTPIDLSVKTPSRSGATWIDARNKKRKWTLQFDWLSPTEAFGWVEDLDQLCGTSQNVMVVRDCSSTNLGRDTLCGLLAQGTPTITREGFIDGANARSKAYDIETRL